MLIMSIKGQLKLNSLPGYTSLPLYSPMLQMSSDMTTFHHRDCDILSFRYRTDGEIASQLIPDIFTLEEYPLATFSVNRMGMSYGGGEYYCSTQAIEVEFEGERLMLDTHQVETTTFGTMAGHPLGIPKVDGFVELTKPSSGLHLISGIVERPARIQLATAVFRAEKFLGEQEEKSYERFGVRVHPSWDTNDSPGLQVTKVKSKAYGGDVWTGTGSLHF